MNADHELFLFSSKTIPGNERGVGRIMNQFSEKGVEVVDDYGGRYHVSGHANRPDLVTMHKLVQAQIVVPMHGEHRHLREHANLAKSNGFQSIIAPNGVMVNLSGNEPVVAGYVDTGRLYLDGSVLIGAMDGIVRDRIRMALNGHVLVTVLIDEENELMGEPWCELKGLPEKGRSNAPLLDILEADLDQFLGRAKRTTLKDDDKLEAELKKVVRKSSQDEIGKKPEVTVVVSRLA